MFLGRLAIGLKRKTKLAERVGFESASYMETNEFCGAPLAF
jgi:hypothetical protein